MVAHCRSPHVFQVVRVGVKAASAGAPGKAWAPGKPDTETAMTTATTKPRTRFNPRSLRTSQPPPSPAKGAGVQRIARFQPIGSVDRYAERPLVRVVEEQPPGADGRGVDVRLGPGAAGADLLADAELSDACPDQPRDLLPGKPAGGQQQPTDPRV